VRGMDEGINAGVGAVVAVGRPTVAWRSVQAGSHVARVRASVPRVELGSNMMYMSSRGGAAWRGEGEGGLVKNDMTGGNDAVQG
jgi:hypothetical protein